MPRILLLLIILVWFPVFYESKSLKEVLRSLPLEDPSVKQSPFLFCISDDSQFWQQEDEDPRTCWRVSFLLYLDAERKSVGQWFHTEAGTVGCIHRTFIDNICVIWLSTDKMEGFICLRRHSSRCGSCLGAIESNRNHQVFRNRVLGKHWASKYLKGRCKEGGNLCIPYPLKQELAQIVLRQNYLGLY